VTPTFTAWDADGGFAEYVTVPAAYAYDLAVLGDAFDDEHAAPLLCAGIIGYRALREGPAARPSTPASPPPSLAAPASQDRPPVHSRGLQRSDQWPECTEVSASSKLVAYGTKSTSLFTA
jgi:hypothetical protein